MTDPISQALSAAQLVQNRFFENVYAFACAAAGLVALRSGWEGMTVFHYLGRLLARFEVPNAVFLQETDAYMQRHHALFEDAGALLLVFGGFAAIASGFQFASKAGSSMVLGLALLATVGSNPWAILGCTLGGTLAFCLVAFVTERVPVIRALSSGRVWAFAAERAWAPLATIVSGLVYPLVLVLAWLFAERSEPGRAGSVSRPLHVVVEAPGPTGSVPVFGSRPASPIFTRSAPVGTGDGEKEASARRAPLGI